MSIDILLSKAIIAKNIASSLTSSQKNDALNAIASGLLRDEAIILAANNKDVRAARDKIGEVMLDRLVLTSERIKAMSGAVRELALLEDCVGETIDTHVHSQGFTINKIRVPLGVVAIIYESRPNVTADAAALCIKSGNVCVLRGGKEAFCSNLAIANSIRQSLQQCSISPDIVLFVEDKTRQSASELMQARGKIDLLIPRGGTGLIRACVDNAKVPCIETGTGINHIYVDKYARLDKAVKIIVNAKTSRPSVCNAAEVCLVHKDIATVFLPMLSQAMQASNTELRLCEKSANIISGVNAQNADFDTEFLDYIMAVKIVESIAEATEHIALHSTGHSDAIITENSNSAEYFCSRVDSAAVYVNVSTRFTDGGEFGLGCEMGISTQKLGARGPMGLKELTTYKYIINGDGQIR